VRELVSEKEKRIQMTFYVRFYSFTLHVRINTQKKQGIFMGHTTFLCRKFLHFCASGIDIWGSRKNYYNGIFIFLFCHRMNEKVNLLAPAMNVENFSWGFFFVLLFILEKKGKLQGRKIKIFTFSFSSRQMLEIKIEKA